MKRFLLLSIGAWLLANFLFVPSLVKMIVTWREDLFAGMHWVTVDWATNWLRYAETFPWLACLMLATFIVSLVF